MESNPRIKFRNKPSSGSHGKKLKQELGFGNVEKTLFDTFLVLSDELPTEPQRRQCQAPTFEDFWPISTCFHSKYCRFLSPKIWARQFLVGKLWRCVFRRISQIGTRM